MLIHAQHKVKGAQLNIQIRLSLHPQLQEMQKLDFSLL